MGTSPNPRRCRISVGACTSGSTDRTSSSASARRDTWATLGLALARCPLANQLRKRPSPARLGTSRAAMASVPHNWSNWSTTASSCSGGAPIG